MPNVAEVIRDHITLGVECVDRLYLNAYVPGLQRGDGVVAFLRQRGQAIASPALFAEITNTFKTTLQAFCSARSIPWIEFTKGQDKDKLVEGYRQQFTADEGVVLVGVAQERAKSWTATKQVDGRRVHFNFSWRTVFVNHYYIYLIDRQWGPAFIKVCGYAPYAVKVCLNGHAWAKRQAQRQGIAYQALDRQWLPGVRRPSRATGHLRFAQRRRHPDVLRPLGGLSALARDRRRCGLRLQLPTFDSANGGQPHPGL